MIQREVMLQMGYLAHELDTQIDFFVGDFFASLVFSQALWLFCSTPLFNITLCYSLKFFYVTFWLRKNYCASASSSLDNH